MWIVDLLALQLQVGPQPVGKFGGKANLHGAAIGLFVMEGSQNSLPMFHKAISFSLVKMLPQRHEGTKFFFFVSSCLRALVVDFSAGL